MTENTSSKKLAALRTLLEKKKLDGFLVQRSDLFQGEEVRPCDERLAYISGFTGSAGYALILKTTAALFSDQRYSLQMQKQTNSNEWKCYDITTYDIKNAILDSDKIEDEIIIGYHSWTMTAGQVEKLPKTAGDTTINWVALDNSLIDEIWIKRPDAETTTYWNMPDAIAGMSAKQKIAQLYNAQSGCGQPISILVSNVDSVNWLLNIRGNSLAHTPFFHAMLLVCSTYELFIISDSKPAISLR